MVAHTNKPVTFKEKEYYRQDYAPASTIKYRDKISSERKLPGGRLSTSHESIDRIFQMPANDRFHQRASEKHDQREYVRTSPENSCDEYLTQPVWFEKIMQEIEKDRKKISKQSIQKQLYLFQN